MASVTFPVELGGDGSTVTDDASPTTGLKNGGWRTRFVPCLSNTVAIANQIATRTIFGSDTSVTSNSISVGSKVFATAGLLRWAAGMYVTVARTSAPTASNMYGQVTAYDSFTSQVTINITNVVGSGTFTDWTIAIAPPGLAAFSFTGATTIAVNSTSDALRITQTGTGNALVVEDSISPDATPFVVNTDGQVLIGALTANTKVFDPQTTTPRSPNVQIPGINSVTASQAIIGWSSNSGTFYAPTLYLARSASGTINTQSPVTNGMPLGSVMFSGDDGTNFVGAALIQAYVDGAPGTNDMPGRLVFSTTRDGASSPTERMRIDNAGSVGIGSTSPGGFNGTLTVAGNGNPTGGYLVGVQANMTASSSVTTRLDCFYSAPNTAVAAFTLTNLNHYFTQQGTIGAGSAVTNQYGFNATATLTGATNNYGFYSAIASGSGRYNFYAAGTADNYFGGKLLLGSATSVTTRGNDNTFQLQGIAYAQASATISRFNSGSTGGPGFEFNRSRNGSLGGNTVVLSGDTLGEMYFNGADGTAFIPAASIIGQVDGTPGPNDMPGRLVFNTTADGASSPTERLRIDNAGNVYGTSGTTAMTNGFFYIPSAAGAPSGVPTVVSGRVPMYYDTTNNNFYIYNGAWKKVLLA